MGSLLLLRLFTRMAHSEIPRFVRLGTPLILVSLCLQLAVPQVEAGGLKRALKKITGTSSTAKNGTSSSSTQPVDAKRSPIFSVVTGNSVVVPNAVPAVSTPVIPSTRVQTDDASKDLDKEEKKQEKESKKAQKEEEKLDKKQSEDKAKADEEREKGKVRGDAPCLSWVKFGQPIKAVLLCVHGLGLNSSSFTKFGQDLSQQGIATYAIDVRGFGSWMEAKGHKKVDFDDCIEDVRKTLEWLQKAHPGKPVFLLGESMGGAIVLHAAAKYPDSMNGVISVCSSGDRFKQKRTDLKIFLHALTGPTRQMNIGKSVVEQAAGDNERLKASWEGDELDRMKLSPMELMSFQSFMNDTHDQVVKITNLPVLMVQGTADQLVKPEGTQELYDELATKDKQIMMVQDAQHLIFENQQCPAATLSSVVKWISNRSPQVDLYDKAKAAFDNGRYQVSLQILKEVLASSPQNANAHLLMGEVQAKLNHPLLARQHLVLASRLGKGTAIPTQANRLMMSLPQGFVGPRLASSHNQANQFTKPTALVFNATWCRPCNDMTEIVEKAKVRLGNTVEFKVIDVDDPANDALVEEYSIGPVPTTVFVSPEGQVAAYQVGYDDGIDGLMRGIAKILPRPAVPVVAAGKQPPKAVARQKLKQAVRAANAAKKR